MKKSYLLILLLLFVVIVSCAKLPVTPDKNPVTPSEKRTCSGLSGFVCSQDEECNGSILDSSDSSSCCNIKCQGKQLEQKDIEPPKFSFGNLNNDNLGSL